MLTNPIYTSFPSLANRLEWTKIEMGCIFSCDVSDIWCSLRYKLKNWFASLARSSRHHVSSQVFYKAGNWPSWSSLQGLTISAWFSFPEMATCSRWPDSRIHIIYGRIYGCSLELVIFIPPAPQSHLPKKTPIQSALSYEPLLFCLYCCFPRLGSLRGCERAHVLVVRTCKHLPSVHPRVEKVRPHETVDECYRDASALLRKTR